SFHKDNRTVICECPLFSLVFFRVPSDARNNTLSPRELASQALAGSVPASARGVAERPCFLGCLWCRSLRRSSPLSALCERTSDLLLTCCPSAVIGRRPSPSTMTR